LKPEGGIKKSVEIRKPGESTPCAHAIAQSDLRLIQTHTHTLSLFLSLSLSLMYTYTHTHTHTHSYTHISTP
jgi:hypothetical protein